MLRTSIYVNSSNAIEIIKNQSNVISAKYYKGYHEWLNNKFIPNYEKGNCSIITAHDKTYKTLVGFALVKHDEEENKLCNLSPLLDGVGITQLLLETVDFVLPNDYYVDVPINQQADRLSEKLIKNGYENVLQNLSKDNTMQNRLYKPRNIKWV